ncbi:MULTISPECIES: gamma-glutamyl-gamma-aminobutyrate hydrolase family protein [unclassified Enterococcus]|uniref:gamma-glutamyl-gamma-aminobutyrate hydrolase family protein n=1 Tax=unclassified Enterococcus TaxID=2608891 RepID=UPI001553B585|nr:MULTISPECIES: gamma-glutamyl-gamma-aminobutyrate hydrolase family protein [unclassified Enterococcus]MBS7576863.1 gamma-glutamyl-gamma-aminobutyrate hydrolase family protein [Enterococcus sp. MMGLQ5-2]MBS7584270.1 gamma-glutamyl-gamma-aminobutyrate hydrolase family protein [Enterococcus sp. MMGLQ5-1]NPD12126.1 gamma-glutamyl-gamma-aminobutyrate hydrolase family protein [Enterococcus sp. MMGLQ5-1]NPD36698.1 gamma-glutamyl-gamma-aminobutyrate hydrolase family protein [Enterococcus sp. MMGLQ5-2
MTKIVGIAGNRVIESIDYFHGNPVDYIQTELVEGLQLFDALPIILPIGKPELAEQYVEKIDILVLGGGQDISPIYYNEEPIHPLGMTFPPRDAFEIALVQAALHQKKAIFGLCRGMQLINVALGGTLYQDINQLPEITINHLQAPTRECFKTHRIKISNDSLLGHFLPDECLVNSYHHQAIKNLADGVVATAHSTDGVIEAFESPANRILAVQWHPEMLWRYHENERCLFKYIVEQL